MVYLHSFGFEHPMMHESKAETEGMQMARNRFVVISPIVPDIRQSSQDAYLNTYKGAEVLQWLSELLFNVTTKGLPGPDGRPRVDIDRVGITGVSLGGAITYILGARCSSVLAGAVPVAAYHTGAYQDALARGLARLPVYCVHSSSPNERTCPIADELPLWQKTRLLGGDLEVKEVTCKHGKSFSHAYEIDTAVWDWLLKQRRAR